MQVVVMRNVFNVYLNANHDYLVSHFVFQSTQIRQLSVGANFFAKLLLFTLREPVLSTVINALYGLLNIVKYLLFRSFLNSK